ncbi:uncharacterized protein LOC107460110 [Arachis duranensis]|uniref:Uncharacterized protein LOC107460110 n=1 Tax=Arachis duranensis TaxID=130453 RepID=A0A6P4AZU6_ARADU|nr:uncharacterized protein LOC107460110 [Arachis duranensis]
MDETSSILLPTQRYAAAALFALALHHSQIHQSQTPDTPHADADGDATSPASAKASVSDDSDLWIHDKRGLLFPVFRFLGVDDQAWCGLKETAGSSPQVRDHVGAFLKLLSEEGDAASSERLAKEAALAKVLDITVESKETDADSSGAERGSHELKNGNQGDSSNATTESSAVVAQPRHETIESSVLVPQKKEASLALENDVFEEPLEEATHISYQRKVTVLYALLSACVADIAKDDKNCCRARQGYDARHRVALRLLALWLGVKSNEMEAMESMVVYSVMNSAIKGGDKEEETVEAETNWDKWKRGGIIGAAALTGGTLMAITGGLAAPAIAHGLTALAPTLGTIVPAIGTGGFAAAATATGSAAGSVAVAASFGAAGAGLTGSKMATRIGSLEEFELKEIGDIHQGRLAVGIFISGLAFQEKDFVEPWEGYCNNMERYVLQYESQILIALSTAIQDWIRSKIMLELMKDGAMLTVLSTLVSALAWPATLVTAFDFIDSRWAIAVDRSDKAGKVLADVLLKGLQGNRPVTLVGFSLGARVIFKCLQCLAEAEGDNAGLVERVVILGAPISIKDENWEAARKMVAGRFVNAYSKNDWTLGVTFRASLLSQGLAGIQPVDVPGMENIDVTQLIEGHASYLQETRNILKYLELDNYNSIFRNEPESPQGQKSTAS